MKKIVRLTEAQLYGLIQEALSEPFITSKDWKDFENPIYDGWRDTHYELSDFLAKAKANLVGKYLNEDYRLGKDHSEHHNQIMCIADIIQTDWDSQYFRLIGKNHIAFLIKASDIVNLVKYGKMITNNSCRQFISDSRVYPTEEEEMSRNLDELGKMFPLWAQTNASSEWEYECFLTLY